MVTIFVKILTVFHPLPRTCVFGAPLCACTCHSPIFVLSSCCHPVFFLFCKYVGFFLHVCLFLSSRILLFFTVIFLRLLVLSGVSVFFFFFLGGGRGGMALIRVLPHLCLK